LTYNDIKLFVNDKLARNKRMLQLFREDPGSANLFVDEIVRRACGVFLWVALVVKSLMAGLRNCDDIPRLRKRLKALPTDLEALYAHMLSSIDPFYQEDAAAIIQLVECSLEHPCVGQLFNILALDRALSATYQSTMVAPITPAWPLQRASSLSRFFDDTPMPDCSIPGNQQPALTITVPENSRPAKYERLETFMKSCCMGLLEVSPSKFAYTSGRDGIDFSGIDQFPAISYIHATARDFITKPETWSIIRKNASKKAPPELSILMSHILLFKK
jgi:hypothetical protein